MVKKIQCIVSFFLIWIGFSMYAWAVWPEQNQSFEQYILPDGMSLPSDSQTPQRALLEARRVSLLWPKSMRIGDESEIKLVFEPVTSEIIVPPPQDKLSDAYNDYNLMAEGRIEVAGMNIRPANPRRESLPAGQVVNFTWLVSAQEAGRSTGNIWLSLRFLPLGGGQAVELPIFIHAVDFLATNLLGLNGGVVRFLGGIGIILGLALNLRNFYRPRIKNEPSDNKSTKG